MARNVTIRDIDLGWDNTVRNLAAIDGAGVDTGFFDDEGPHPNGDGEMVSEIAIKNEFGTDTIPARPFFATTYAQHEARFFSRASFLFGAVANGQLTLDQALTELGAIQVTRIKETINKWTSPPNAPATIARKDKNDPLVDTGFMRDSVKSKKIRQ